MSNKKNCWEFTACGREAGGAKVHELGICSASITKSLDGVHGGLCGGRACWGITGTLCHGVRQVSYASKLKNCLKCEFYQAVLREHSRDKSFLKADQIYARYLGGMDTGGNIPLKIPMDSLVALVLDTNVISRRITTSCLEQQGLTVRCAKDMDEAKAIAMGKETIHMVIAEVLVAEASRALGGGGRLVPFPPPTACFRHCPDHFTMPG